MLCRRLSRAGEEAQPRRACLALFYAVPVPAPTQLRFASSDLPHRHARTSPPSGSPSVERSSNRDDGERHSPAPSPLPLSLARRLDGGAEQSVQRRVDQADLPAVQPSSSHGQRPRTNGALAAGERFDRVRGGSVAPAPSCLLSRLTGSGRATAAGAGCRARGGAVDGHDDVGGTLDASWPSGSRWWWRVETATAWLPSLWLNSGWSVSGEPMCSVFQTWRPVKSGERGCWRGAKALTSTRALLVVPEGRCNPTATTATTTRALDGF